MRIMFKDLIKLFFAFFKIGLFTIGGGMAMLPIIQDVVVNRHKWISQEDMLDCIALSQAVPGIIAVSCGTYVGKRLYDFKGSLAATLGVLCPSFIIIIGMVFVLELLEGNAYVDGALIGIKAAVTGAICITLYKMAGQILHDPFSWAMAIIAFVMVAVIKITAVWAIAFGAAVGIAAVLIGRKTGSEGDES